MYCLYQKSQLRIYRLRELFENVPFDPNDSFIFTNIVIHEVGFPVTSMNLADVEYFLVVKYLLVVKYFRVVKYFNVVKYF